MAASTRLALHAGHGLNYQNVARVANLLGMRELNIGHSVVSRAVMVGMERAVFEQDLVAQARGSRRGAQGRQRISSTAADPPEVNAAETRVYNGT